jgi:hypothetical protein
MSYRTDEKDLQREKEREHEKNQEKLREQQGAQPMRIFHPGWALVLGMILMLAVLLIWFFATS